MRLQGLLDQLHPLEAGVAFLADDQMVVHGNSERARDFDDGLRHLDVGARGRRIAGGMIVHQYTRRLIRVVFQWFAKL